MRQIKGVAQDFVWDSRLKIYVVLMVGGKLFIELNEVLLCTESICGRYFFAMELIGANKNIYSSIEGV